MHTRWMIELGTGTAHSSAGPQAFFDRWIEHDSWPEWDPDIRWVRVDGPVRQGTRGVLKPRGGPRVKFVISACVPNREYTDTSTLPGARLIFQHTVEATDNGSLLNARVTMTGPLRRFWGAVMGKNFRTSVQANLDRLVRIVEREP